MHYETNEKKKKRTVVRRWTMIGVSEATRGTILPRLVPRATEIITLLFLPR